MEHYTVEDLRKCEILRENGYKVSEYQFKYPTYLYGWFGFKMQTTIVVCKLIAYKEDIEEITQDFAEMHIMQYMFDRFVAKGE